MSPSCAAELAACLQKNAAFTDNKAAFPTQEMDWLTQAGLLRREMIQLPATEILQTLWHIGRGNLAVGRLYEGHVNALQLVQWFGTAAQQDRLFNDADAGKLFAVWNTQATDGVSFESSDAGWQMNGSKTFCSGAGNVLRPIVTGQLGENGWQMVVLKAEEAEMAINSSWWQPLGMWASASYKTDFSGTWLHNDNLLGHLNDYYSQPAFSGGAIRFCAVQLGGAAAIFDETRRFLRETGRTEDTFQQMRVGHMAAHIQSGWQWIENAGVMWDSLGEEPNRVDEQTAAQMVAFAAMMRVATEEICVSVMHMSEKSIGARGLMKSEPFERMIRDLTMYLKQPHLDEIPCRVGRFALQSNLRSDELWNSNATF